MINYDIDDMREGGTCVKTNLSGHALLASSLLNKGCAFTLAERQDFSLLGLLPDRFESLEEQTSRAYEQIKVRGSDIEKNLYLQELYNTNQTLFYSVLTQHLAELLPIIYTPTVGVAAENFSLYHNKPHGLYISYPNKAHMRQILDKYAPPNLALTVVTDGEGIMGIGDHGIGGMHIAIAKLMVYTACAGIPPHRTMPIFLDVGTNNQALLRDKMYLGWRHERIKQDEYDNFIADFMAIYHEKFPRTLLHWEDLGRHNANTILQRYKHSMCTINGDIQSTGVVTLAAIVAAINKSGLPARDHRVVIFGAGSAGTGIAQQLRTMLLGCGLSDQEVLDRLWLIDRHGLLTTALPQLLDTHQDYLHQPAELANWHFTKQAEPNVIGLYDVVYNVKPTILIGCSTMHGAFNAEIVKLMAQHTKYPIIMPLSNPLTKSEAEPQDLLNWTEGRAIIATGSPYKPATYSQATIPIAQCNNALAFPGLGLGVLAVQAARVTDGMLSAAAYALADYMRDHGNSLAILPNISMGYALYCHVALAVATQACREGLAAPNIDEAKLPELINKLCWRPHYLPYITAS